MGKWLRVDCAIDQHPKFLRAGAMGSIVAQACWRLAKEHGLSDGDVTTYWDVLCLARRLQFDELQCRHCDEHLGHDLVAEGMDAALEAGLIEEQDGRYLIHDWRSYQWDRTGYARVQRHRAKKGAGGSGSGSKNDNGGVTDDNALHPVTITDDNVSTVLGPGSMSFKGETRDPSTPERDPSTPTPESEARTMEQYRRAVKCTHCGHPWRLWEGKHGQFYGHGRSGGPTGCKATCDAAEYVAEAAPAKLCAHCGEKVVQDGSQYCAPCLVQGVGQ
jgi:hypothetical protein